MDDGLAVGGGALVLGAVSPGRGAARDVRLRLALVIAGTVGGSDSGAVGTGRDPTGKVNCPECGARNDRDEGCCHHCGADLGSTADSRETADGQDRQ